MRNCRQHSLRACNTSHQFHSRTKNLAERERERERDGIENTFSLLACIFDLSLRFPPFESQWNDVLADTIVILWSTEKFATRSALITRRPEINRVLTQIHVARDFKRSTVVGKFYQITKLLNGKAALNPDSRPGILNNWAEINWIENLICLEHYTRWLTLTNIIFLSLPMIGSSFRGRREMSSRWLLQFYVKILFATNWSRINLRLFVILYVSFVLLRNVHIFISHTNLSLLSQLVKLFLQRAINLRITWYNFCTRVQFFFNGSRSSKWWIVLFELAFVQRKSFYSSLFEIARWQYRHERERKNIEMKIKTLFLLMAKWRNNRKKIDFHVRINIHLNEIICYSSLYYFNNARLACSTWTKMSKTRDEISYKSTSTRLKKWKGTMAKRWKLETRF